MPKDAARYTLRVHDHDPKKLYLMGMRNTAIPCCILRDTLCEASVKYKQFRRVISFGLQYYPRTGLFTT